LRRIEGKKIEERKGEGKKQAAKKKWRVCGRFSKIGSGFQYQGRKKAGGKQHDQTLGAPVKI
jgi:hypothetical protein